MHEIKRKLWDQLLRPYSSHRYPHEWGKMYDALRVEATLPTQAVQAYWTALASFWRWVTTSVYQLVLGEQTF